MHVVLLSGIIPFAVLFMVLALAVLTLLVSAIMSYPWMLAIGLAVGVMSHGLLRTHKPRGAACACG
jgi:uncharacterized membrane protein YhhN